MAYRDDDRDRGNDWRDEELGRDQWFSDYEEQRDRYGRGRNREWESSASEERPRGGMGRWYGRFGSPQGVGSAAGYSGMGGPGWTPGGYGDPGYNTSGFSNTDYGTSRTGRADWRSASREPMPMSRDDFDEYDTGRGGYSGGSDDWRWGSGDYRMNQEMRSRQMYDRSTGPHTGRGPKGYQRGDERIHEDVSERLMDDGRIDASEIEVQVTNGEVTLTGTVDHRRTKRLAEDIAESVRGVRDVHNQLRVGEVGTGRDRELSLSPQAERLNKKTKS